MPRQERRALPERRAVGGRERRQRQRGRAVDDCPGLERTQRVRKLELQDRVLDETETTMAQRGTQSRGGRRSSNSTLRLVAGTVALAGLAYGTYQYLSSSWTGSGPVTAAVGNENDNDGDVTKALSSNRLRPKQRTDVSISLVVSKTVLRQIGQYNAENEDGVDLQDYLRVYPKMVLVLYPGVTPADVEGYFELEDALKSRILETSKEESVFHLLKQLGSEINLVCFADFSLEQHAIDTQFRLDNVLPNVISLNKTFFVDYI